MEWDGTQVLLVQEAAPAARPALFLGSGLWWELGAVPSGSTLQVRTGPRPLAPGASVTFLSISGAQCPPMMSAVPLN